MRTLGAFMRTRYFQDGAPECPLVALVDFHPKEIAGLQADILQLVEGKSSGVTLDGEVELMLQISERDLGVQTRDSLFRCILRAETWENIIGLLEPFTEPEQSGFQWLHESGDIRLLISNTGEW